MQDIHRESEPSGTLDQNRASDRTAIEGAGAWEPLLFGNGPDGDRRRWGLADVGLLSIDLTSAKHLVCALTRTSQYVKSQAV